MALMSRNTAVVPNSQVMENSLIVRINGTLPDLSIMGDEEKSEKGRRGKENGDSC